METVRYLDDVLHVEGVSALRLAEAHGTPSYVYSRAALEERWRAFDQAFRPHDHLICYAVKANSNLAVLDALARLGSGFDIVSGGELERVLAAGGRAERVVFSGVGKSAREMQRALAAGVLCFNVESTSELERLNGLAGESGLTAPVSLRVNPHIDARTHPYIATGLKHSKFGIPAEQALEVYRRASRMRHVRITGLDCHIGSQQTSLAPFGAVVDRLIELADALLESGIALEHLDLGGGFGVRYRDESPPDPLDYARTIGSRAAERGLKLIVEPGRAVVADAGLLLTRIEYLKHDGDRHFAVVDAAMNDLLRPALYDAWQDVVPVTIRHESDTDPVHVYDVVGPVCESADFLARERPLAVREGDLLAIRCAGAYGFVMSSNYNSRPRPPELMVDDERVHVARRREGVDDLMAGESRLPD